MDDKTEAFVEWLMGDIFRCLGEAVCLKIGISTDREGERCVPEGFFCTIVAFSREFVDGLMSDIMRLPILFLSSEDFFKRLTNAVCMKLIRSDIPDIAFLKVTAFLVVISTLSFTLDCFRTIDNIPPILVKLLKEHIETRFYEEGKFDGIVSQCELLKEDDTWGETAVKEIQTYMKDSLKAELAATTLTWREVDPDRRKVRILDVMDKKRILKADKILCPYCCTTCINFLTAFWKPKIMYKPEFWDDSNDLNRNLFD